MVDTSETYIKMCQEAEALQGLRPIPKEVDGEWQYIGEEGDVYAFWWVPSEPRYGDAHWNSYVATENEYQEDGTVWLPRQDQLQEMVCGKFEVMAEAVQWLYSEIAPWPKPPSEYYRSFKSFEQIWLAFVMKEKYGKTWNGEDWVSD